MTTHEMLQKLMENAQLERKKNFEKLMVISQQKKELETAINQIDGAIRAYQLASETFAAIEAEKASESTAQVVEKV